MLSFEQAGEILDDVADSLPEEIFQGLNGGVSLLPRRMFDEDGFCIMGQYIVDAMGRRVEIYYGSFRELYADEPDDVVRRELRATLLHELTHHLESRAGDRSLELWDIVSKQESLAQMLQEEEQHPDSNPPRPAARCRIVHAGPEHVPEIAQLERLCFSDPWPENILMQNLTDGERKICLVALEDETVLGYIQLLYVLDEAEISNIAVDPNERRRKIGSTLVEHAISLCREMGIGLLHLEVRQSNAEARALYEHMGFAATGRRKNYYRFPKEDAILMTKRINV